MNILDIENLNFSYDKNYSQEFSQLILKNINLSIAQGEFVAIQGPSGSGKSTFLYLLGLLSKPLSGKIFFEDKDVSQLTDDELAQLRNEKIGFIFQQFHLLPRTKIIDNVLLPSQYTKNKKFTQNEYITRAFKLIQQVGLENRSQHNPNELSGGQQQRVAICRALLNDPDLILADEPTGNLDSQSTLQILDLLKNLNREYKKTIVIITHDNSVAEKCDRIIRISDGEIVNANKQQYDIPVTITNSKNQKITADSENLENKFEMKKASFLLKSVLSSILKTFPSALKNLERNRVRTALTMIGVSVGISAVFSMVTLGEFTKNKILKGYGDLGVNTLVLSGYPNWDRRATDIVPTPFRFFDPDRDLTKLNVAFPAIEKLSPVMRTWSGSLNFAGRTLDQDVRIMGINEEALSMSKRNLLFGRNFSKVEIEQKSAVCIIGFDIADKLFKESFPLGEVLRIQQDNSSFGCRVIGVLKSTVSNKDYLKPNLQVFLPYTYFQAVGSDYWSTQIFQVMIQVKLDGDIEKTGKSLKTYFTQKYGSSGKFMVDSDSVLLAHMNKFLNLFTLLLLAIALVTLLVGGIGITNMMLVSVAERFREIGLRKAIGATDLEVRYQFITESMIICSIAGFIGLAIGFMGYHLAIWISTQFMSSIKFEFVFNFFALALSLISILLVGVLSGIFPALKAEKLQVIEALRSE